MMKDAMDNHSSNANETEHQENAPTGIIIAVDIGSSSIRCTAYEHNILCPHNGDGLKTIAVPGCFSSIQRRGVDPTTGTIRTNDMLEALNSTIDDVLSKLNDVFAKKETRGGYQVDAVGFSTFVMNLVAINEYGDLVPSCDDVENDNNQTVISDIGMSYACNDPEVGTECEQLRQELGPMAIDALYQATGAPLHSAYALPQLRVLYKHENKGMHIPRIYKWQSIAGYCISKWTGRKELPISYSEASWTGLLNVHNCEYEETAIRYLTPECQASLPELADFTDYIHGIPTFVTDYKDTNRERKTFVNPYWERWPALRNAKFFLGVGDGACANIGSKCTTQSRIAVTVGTSAAARICLKQESRSVSTEAPVFSIPNCRGLFCYRIDKSHVLIGGALTDGGSIVEWASKFLNLDQEGVMKCLEQAEKLVQIECERERQNPGGSEPQSHGNSGLIVAPFLSGERSIGYRDGAKGAVFGLTRDTTPAHFFKTCLESVSLRLKAVLDRLLLVRRESIDDSSENKDDSTLPIIVASGKAMEVNNLWRQMISDSSGLRVALDRDTNEGTSRGVARLVAGFLQIESEGRVEISSSNNTIEKREENHRSFSCVDFKEDLNPFIMSKPSLKGNALYKRKLQAQEAFIESISPLFNASYIQ